MKRAHFLVLILALLLLLWFLLTYQTAPQSLHSPMNEIIPGIFVGNYKAADDVNMLYQKGITCVLDCAKELPDYAIQQNGDMELMRLDLEDTLTEDLLRVLPASLAWLSAHRENGDAILIHCAAGRSRSVAVCVAFLIHTYHISPTMALDMVQQRRPHAQPNANFMKQLQVFWEQESRRW